MSSELADSRNENVDQSYPEVPNIMRRFILWSALAGLSLGIAGCGSSSMTGPVDATKPPPAEPPADGFVPKDAPK